ncbi:hypothetical protein M758_8G110100 [Ceratodon purpureus]|nr:hypothetical protein M758_8G110100 [Ceratodon purpureus]
MDPPEPPAVRYFYSKTVAQNLSFLYRVISLPDQQTCRCYPEARGWPILTMTEEELERNLLQLRPEEVTIHNASGAVSFPDYDEFRNWQLGRSVYFCRGGERTYGIVVGKFVWRSAIAESSPASSLRLLALIRQRTNELILSSEVTELYFDNGDLAKNREDVYIQGISLVGIVATLIANVTYVASTTPPRGLNSSRNGIAFASYLVVPKVFLFFNAVAFYASVLSVVLMTALIPIYGTAGEWGAIFLSSSVPAILSLVSCYVAFMISTWAIMDSVIMPVGTTLMGIVMVIYIRCWAVELMRGHVERSLHIHPLTSPWKWYLERGRGETMVQRLPGRLGRFRDSFKTLREILEPAVWRHQLLGLGLHSRGIPVHKLQHLFGKNASSCITAES